MQVVLQQLFSPIGYLLIRHPSKACFDWVIPVALTAGLTGLWLIAPSAIPLRGPEGAIAAITEFVKFLAGFYITALAAIATFERPGMDELMENPPTLRGAPLSRRRFLARMFGYLAFVSIALYVVGVIASLAAPSFLMLVSNELAREVVRGSFFMLYGVIAMNLMTTTLLSLYFLSDRIIRYTPKVVPSGGAGPMERIMKSR